MRDGSVILRTGRICKPQFRIKQTWIKWAAPVFTLLGESHLMHQKFESLKYQQKVFGNWAFFAPSGRKPIGSRTQQGVKSILKFNDKFFQRLLLVLYSVNSRASGPAIFSPSFLSLGPYGTDCRKFIVSLKGNEKGSSQIGFHGVCVTKVNAFVLLNCQCLEVKWKR